MNTTRRQFLRSTVGSSALISLTATAPQFLLNASAAATAHHSKSENILVVVQLSGGNDGINTVIPYADDLYAANRFTLRVSSSGVHKINDHVGLHPNMKGFSDLLEDGKLSILQGIGYPNPDRSHFKSMDIWHTAQREEGHRGVGWIGRCLDRIDGNPFDVPAVHLGSDRQPLALVGERIQAPTIDSIKDFKLDDDGNRKLRESMTAAAQAERSQDSPLLSFLQQGIVSAIASSERVQEALRSYSTSIKYPPSRLAQQLRTVAQLIDADLKTRIYYLTLGGFDTHANQSSAHPDLLRQLSDGITAFLQDLTLHGHGQRVLVMTFSEFGRRLRENASRGTDHGAAAPMFLAGGGVKPGVIGEHPSMTDLDQGDLKFHTDFRSVYAAVLEDWLKFDSKAILGATFEPLPVLNSSA